MILLRIGKTSSQSISVKRIGRKGPMVPSVGISPRPGETLIVIEKNPVIANESKLIGIKQELRGTDMHAARIFVTYVKVTGKTAMLVVCGEFPAINFTFPVVKG